MWLPVVMILALPSIVSATEGSNDSVTIMGLQPEYGDCAPAIPTRRGKRHRRVTRIRSGRADGRQRRL
jgi:hypothetical protein